MILEEETYKRFSYNSTKLVSGSHKKILAACDECGKIREIEKRQYRALCASCSRRGKRNYKNRVSDKIKCKCKTCGKEFLVLPCQIKRGEGQYCSRECYRKIAVGDKSSNWRGGKVTCVCIECKVIFKVAQNQIKNGGGKFCSRKCLAKWRSKNLRREKSTAWKGGKITRICKQCRKSFEVDPSRLKQNRGKYCSKICMNKSMEREKIKCFCKSCNKEFEICQSELKKGGGIFCSQKCRYEFKQGENAPNWKNGTSFEPYCHKFNEEFKQYIRAKFGNVCFLCDKTEEENGQKLSVHHVNYDKYCGCAETEEDKKADDKSCQFVPLCRSCNSKVNGNRELWERRIKNEMRNKLNGWFI